MQLVAQCLWHKNIPSGATVTCLVGVPDSSSILCGIEGEHICSQLLELDAQTGELKHNMQVPGYGSVLMVSLDLCNKEHFYACTADGVLSLLKLPASQVISSFTLPTPSSNIPSSVTSSAHVAHSTPNAASAVDKDLAEFCPSLGYRGPQSGYIYREGALGKGYYRNDVVKKYACSTENGNLEEKTGIASVSILGLGNKRLRCCTAVSIKKRLIGYASSDPNDGRIFICQLPLQDDNGGNTEATTLAILHGHASATNFLRFSPDENYLFSGSYDQTIRVWKTATWQCEKVLKGHGGGIRALEISEDGLFMYSAAADNTVRAWSTEKWLCLRLMHGRHEDATWPSCMALFEAKDNSANILVTGSTGPFGACTLKAFNPSNGNCLATFAQLKYDERGGITAVAFDSCTKFLYSAASDGTVAAWSLQEGGEGGRDIGAKQKTTLRKGFLG